MNAYDSKQHGNRNNDSIITVIVIITVRKKKKTLKNIIQKMIKKKMNAQCSLTTTNQIGPKQYPPLSPNKRKTKQKTKKHTHATKTYFECQETRKSPLELQEGATFPNFAKCGPPRERINRET